MIKYTICFIKKGTKFLMLNRNKHPNMGLWNGVGGKIEPDETPVDSMLREVYEETGLRVSKFRYGGVVKWISEGETSGMHLYVAEMPRVYYSTPIQKDEGLLEWKEIDWILDSKNKGVVENIHSYLPIALGSHMPKEHMFFYENNEIVSYQFCPMKKEVVTQ